MIGKVLAYITRHENDQIQLLVFDHRAAPEAGTQVPAGTVEEGESTEAALWREILEESGLSNLNLIRKLAVHESAEWNTVRHVFHLTVPGDVPDSWSHTVRGKGEDEGMIFDYRWTALTPQLELAGNQHTWLDLILNALPQKPGD
jgi:ADP-ribose pyrophosphatase YjhB (NUDIX family)